MLSRFLSRTYVQPQWLFDSFNKHTAMHALIVFAGFTALPTLQVPKPRLRAAAVAV
jgi:hypothetical protein